MIHKVGSEYQVTNEAGNKILGRHKSLADAKKQLAAIEISKARASGKKIPKPSSK
jgi:hypothetical protein